MGAMNIKPEELYLDLLKKTLSFSLWPEPPIPIETQTMFNADRSALKKWAIAAIARLLKLKQLTLVRPAHYTEKQRTDGAIWPGYADTMIGLKRLDNIQACVETVLREGVEGDLIETGVWRGGACIFMRAVLAAHGIGNRKVYVADSFEGLPEPDPEKYPADAGDTYHLCAALAISQEDVENNFRKYGLLDGQVVFLKGWFKDTLPHAPVEKLAILRLDGDMYGSTMDALGNLYPKLSRGGYCIIDDYALKGCKQAVDDYRAQFKISAPMTAVDWSGVYWRKSEA